MPNHAMPCHAKPGQAMPEYCVSVYQCQCVSISLSKQPTGSNCGASSHSFQRHSRELREKPGNIKQKVFHPGSFSQVRGLFTSSPNHGFYTKRQKFHFHEPWIPLRSFWSMIDFSLNIENTQLHSLWHRSRKCWRETNQKTCKGESSGGHHLLLLLTRGLPLVTRSPCYLLSGRRVSYWVGRCTQNKLTNAVVGGLLGPN